MLTLETFVAAAVEKSDGQGDKKPGDSETDLPDGSVAIEEDGYSGEQQYDDPVVEPLD